MPNLVTIEGIDQALANITYKPGTQKARLLGLVHEYFSEQDSLDTITSIPPEELVSKLWQTEDPAVIKTKRKSLSSLKSAINKDLKALADSGKNPEGVTLNRDNIFTVSEEKKNTILQELGVTPGSMNSVRNLFSSLRDMVSQFSGDTDVSSFKDLLKELDETKKAIRRIGNLPDADGDDEGTGSDEKESMPGFAGPLIEGSDEGTNADPVTGDGTEPGTHLDDIEVIDEDIADEVVEEVIDDETEEEIEDELIEEILSDDIGEETAEELPALTEEDVEVIDGDIEDEWIKEDSPAEEIILEDDNLNEATDDDITEIVSEDAFEDDDLETVEDEITEDDILSAGGDEETEVLGHDTTGSSEEEALEILTEDDVDDDDIEVVEDVDEEDDLPEEEQEIFDDDDIEVVEDEVEGDDLPLEDQEIFDEDDVEVVEDEVEEDDLPEEEQEIFADDDVEVVEDGVEEDDLPLEDQEIFDDDDIEVVEDEVEGEDLPLVDQEIFDEDDVEVVEDEVGEDDLPLVDQEIFDDDDIEVVEDEVEEDDLPLVDQEIFDEDDVEVVEDGVEEDDLPLEDQEIFDEDDVEVVEEEVEEELIEDAKGVEILDDDDYEIIDEDDIEDLDHKPSPKKRLLEVLSDYMEPEQALQETDILSEEQEEYISQILKRFTPAFVKIPEGHYQIGCPSPATSEHEARSISLKSFHIGQYPVTNDLFELFVRDTGYETEAEKSGFGIVYEGQFSSGKDTLSGGQILTIRKGATANRVDGACWRYPSGPEKGSISGKHSHPAVQVSHIDALAFAAWAGKRLPTEEEWEAAGRGTGSNPYPWGRDWHNSLGTFNSSHSGETTPVDSAGRQGASPFGICDLLGNVYEWTSTPHKSVRSGGRPVYILKGGCWTSNGQITIAHRLIEANIWSNIIGFRCAV